MSSVNKAMIVGNVGKEPEVRRTPAGKAVCTISIATTRRRGKGDEATEETSWHRIVFYERLAEIVGEYVKKGSTLYVEGRISYRAYEKDGQSHNVTEIIADSMQMIGRGPGKPEEKPAAPAAQRRPTHGEMKSARFEDMDDDIPL